MTMLYKLTSETGRPVHGYRCCGNGVVAPVSEWIGRALLAEIESHAA